MGAGTNHAGSNMQGSLTEKEDTVWLRSTPVAVTMVIWTGKGHFSTGVEF